MENQEQESDIPETGMVQPVSGFTNTAKPAKGVSYDTTTQNIIDTLRDLGLDQDFSLPQMVVMGDQSAGKSSVLEALSGIAFPRKSGLGTRCPTELIMRRGDTSSAHVRIRWAGDSLDMIALEEALKRDVLCMDGSNDLGVEIGVDHVGAAISCCSLLITETEEQEISQSCICITLRGPETPELTLIDLPGLIRSTTDDQDESVKHHVRALVDKYRSQPNTIILAVAAANVDAATSEILELARQADPEGTRTIGIVTKPDLVDEGAEKEPLALIRNERIQLLHGYVVVKCRNQMQLNNNVSSKVIAAAESTFFGRSPWNSIDKDRRGIPALCTRLQNQLAAHVESELPALHSSIQEELQKTKHELSELSLPLENDAERRTVWHKMMKQVAEILDCAVAKSSTGYSHHFFSTVGPEARICAHIHKLESAFKKQILETRFPCGGTFIKGDVVKLFLPDHPSGNVKDFVDGEILNINADGSVDVKYPAKDELFKEWKNWSENGTTNKAWYTVLCRDKEEQELGTLANFYPIENESSYGYEVKFPNETLEYYSNDFFLVHKMVPQANISRQKSETQDALRKSIAEQLELNRGDSLPGMVNPAVFTDFVRKLVEQEWKGPAVQLFDGISQSIVKLMKDVFEYTFKSREANMRRCEGYMQKFVADTITRVTASAKLSLMEQIRRECRPHTLNSDFELKTMNCRVETVIDSLSQEVSSGVFDCQLGKASAKGGNSLLGLISATANRLLGNQTEHIFDVYEMENLLSCYWKIAASRFIDHVPQIAHHEIVEAFNSGIEQHFHGVSDKQLELILPVDRNLVARRNMLTKKLDRLEKGIQVLIFGPAINN